MHKGGMPATAPWFQLVLSRDEVPWLFKEEGSSWASASAELLASLVALHLLQQDFKEIISGPGLFRSFFGGGTDNKAAESLSSKLLTTKVPLMFILMQYVDLCDRMGVRCLLNWQPRDANVEADRITKFVLDDFSTGLRVAVSWSELDLSVLNPLLDLCSFRKDLDSVKASLPSETVSAGVRFEKSAWG